MSLLLHPTSPWHYHNTWYFLYFHFSWSWGAMTGSNCFFIVFLLPLLEVGFSFLGFFWIPCDIAIFPFSLKEESDILLPLKVVLVIQLVASDEKCNLFDWVDKILSVFVCVPSVFSSSIQPVASDEKCSPFDWVGKICVNLWVCLLFSLHPWLDRSKRLRMI